MCAGSGWIGRLVQAGPVPVQQPAAMVVQQAAVPSLEAEAVLPQPAVMVVQQAGRPSLVVRSLVAGGVWPQQAAVPSLAAGAGQPLAVELLAVRVMGQVLAQGQLRQRQLQEPAGLQLRRMPQAARLRPCQNPRPTAKACRK